jgi:hypothetical protein
MIVKQPSRAELMFRDFVHMHVDMRVYGRLSDNFQGRGSASEPMHMYVVSICAS